MILNSFNYTSKLNKLLEICVNQGIGVGIRNSLIYALKYSFLSNCFKNILGRGLHQKIIAYLQLGYWPSIQNPTTFNEKIIYRKLYTNKGLYSTLADKWTVRNYVSEKVGDDILNEVYYVSSDEQTIPLQTLPNEFVIKATHASGWNMIIDDKRDGNISSIIEECKYWLRSDYGKKSYEYWYQNIEPKVMIEKRLHGIQQDIPLDYKFFVFHGDVEYIQVDTGRESNHTRRFYDENWNPQTFTKGRPLGPVIRKPSNFEYMKSIAREIGSDLDFARIDLYNTKEEGVIFGEITIAPGAGRSPFQPIDIDYEFGRLW